MIPSATIRCGEFQVDNSVWKCVLCIGRPRKLGPDSGLRKQAEVGWRLASDSCLGNLEGKRKAKLTALVMALSWLGMNKFSYGPCCGVIFDVSNRPSASQGDLSQKGLHIYCLGPKYWEEDSKWTARMEMHLPGLRGTAGTSGWVMKMSTQEKASS